MMTLLAGASPTAIGVVVALAALIPLAVVLVVGAWLRHRAARDPGALAAARSVLPPTGDPTATPVALEARRRRSGRRTGTAPKHRASRGRSARVDPPSVEHGSDVRLDGPPAQSRTVTLLKNAPSSEGSRATSETGPERP